jgi:RNA polymerase sigma factor (sigma-70 family)
VSPKRTTSNTLPSDVGAGASRDGLLPDAVAAVQEHASAAWPQFLEHYSRFILTCIRRYTADDDERMDIYVHVCERLAADDCRRLRQFRGHGRQGKCKFTTWLAAVVYNLARDWIRTSRGRRRLFRSVRELSRTDRLVFRYYFWEGYSRDQIAMLLRSRGRRSCDVADVGQRLASIERKLSRDHRWRLVTSLLRSAGPLSLDQPHAVVGDGPPLEIPDVQEGGVARLHRAEARAVLRGLLDGLPAEERAAVKLRFERGLTAREVAVVLGIRNYKRVYEIQGRALAKLEEGLSRQGFELSDFLEATRDSVRMSG